MIAHISNSHSNGKMVTLKQEMYAQTVLHLADLCSWFRSLITEKKQRVFHTKLVVSHQETAMIWLITMEQKHTTTADDFYGEFRLDFYENPCQVCHPDRKPIDLELEEMELALQLKELELRESNSDKSKLEESISEDSKSVIYTSNNSNQVKSKPENEDSKSGDSISNGSKTEESNAQNFYLQKIKLIFVSNNFCKLF